ncbi:hypothetical protein [Spiroplasma sp. SV19]|uniref:hypothetical protein n=1 Tax=Spiroplasma sp. SV19 TaxID=2570468 RepID=UPI0024B80787|nr:hypothetical protein [Spiroplasma sp. SV19]WHQ36403.1 hypothetical protein E7Y35_00380 [Spiroplasma sp. SV19]
MKTINSIIIKQKITVPPKSIFVNDEITLSVIKSMPIDAKLEFFWYHNNSLQEEIIKTGTNEWISEIYGKKTDEQTYETVGFFLYLKNEDKIYDGKYILYRNKKWSIQYDKIQLTIQNLQFSMLNTTFEYDSNMFGHFVHSKYKKRIVEPLNNMRFLWEQERNPDNKFTDERMVELYNQVNGYNPKFTLDYYKKIKE